MFKRKTAVFAVGLLVVAALAAVLINYNNTCCADSPGTTVQDITPANYQEQFVTGDEPHLLIDVRTTEEFSSGHIRGALNIPLDSLADHLSEIPDDQPVVVYCRSGNRSAQASQILAQAGYSSIYDLGGITTWTAQGFPVE
jgi:rhodanese-related sulfurtransferase